MVSLSYLLSSFTSILPTLTLVIIDFTQPSNTSTDPEVVAYEVVIPAVNAYPTWSPKVPIETLWSAKLSITQTLSPFPHDPGSLDE